MYRDGRLHHQGSSAHHLLQICESVTDKSVFLPQKVLSLLYCPGALPYSKEALFFSVTTAFAFTFCIIGYCKSLSFLSPD